MIFENGVRLRNILIKDQFYGLTVFHQLTFFLFLVDATHTDDMPTFFNCSLYFLPLKRNTPHFELSTKMTNLLANFADKG